jgi:hypothetical protein
MPDTNTLPNLEYRGFRDIGWSLIEKEKKNLVKNILYVIS